MESNLAQPNGSPRKTKQTRGSHNPGLSGSGQRVSTCGVCQFGVYQSDERVWSNGFDGPAGINHSACVSS